MPNPGVSTALTRSVGLPGPAPRVDEIRRAYGDPSEVRDDTLAGGVPVRVHFYGSLGFAVAPDDREGRVIGLVRLLRAGAEPGRGRAASTPQKPRAVPKDRPSFWVSTGKRSISWTRPPSELKKEDPKLPPLLKFFKDEVSATVSSHCEGGTCVADVELLTALDPSTIPELTRLLRKPPWEAKKVIPVYVEDDGKEETVALYIDGAHVGGRVVREAAATALGWIGPQAAPAVPDLVDALEDHDSHNKLRIVAAAALGWIGPEAREAGPALARHLKTDENVTVRVNCAIALGEVDPEAEATISALKAALQDSTKDVRNAAAETLKKLGRTPR